MFENTNISDAKKAHDFFLGFQSLILTRENESNHLGQQKMNCWDKMPLTKYNDSWDVLSFAVGIGVITTHIALRKRLRIELEFFVKSLKFPY